MAAPSRSSSSRGRSGGSSRSSSSSGGGNQQVMVLGGIGVAVVVVVLIMMGGGDKGPGKSGGSTPTPVAAKPDPTPKPAATPVSSSAKAGKTPTKPAPVLTADTLQKARDLETKMKGFYNEGSVARTAGDNAKAREKQALAKGVLEEIDKLLETPLLWQEEAEMGDWAQPAEYIELAKVHGSIMKLAKMVRMGGG